MKKLLSTVALACVGLCSVNAMAADAYPDAGKTLTIVVPFAAGGPTDKVARDLAETMRKYLKVSSIVVDNVAGAGSTIGTAKVAKANPDGYTILLNHIAMGTMPTFYRKLPFNVENDFEYLGIVNDVPMTVIARPTMAANTYKEFADWINANKGKINMGNAGQASASHLCGMLYQSAIKVDMTTVPYKGTAPAMNDLLGGQIDFMCDQTTNTTSQIAAKAVKAYAVTTAKRLSTPALKSLPTLNESGLKGFEMTIWHGLYAPKGTPADALKAINTALKASLKDADFIKREEALGAEVADADDKRIDAAGHKAFVQSEIKKWAPIIHNAAAYAD